MVNARFVKPIDEEMIQQLSENHSLLVTMEENVQSGGFGEHVNQYISEKGYEVSTLNISIPDVYVEHGSVTILKKVLGIDTDSIVKRILEKTEKLEGNQ